MSEATRTIPPALAGRSSIDLGALVLRLGLGVVMLAHGLTKVFVFTLPGTAAFFESVGYPGPLAYPVTAIT